MLALLPILLLALLDVGDEPRRQATTNELKNRLGLREARGSDLRERLRYCTTLVPEVVQVEVAPGDVRTIPIAIPLMLNLIHVVKASTGGEWEPPLAKIAFPDPDGTHGGGVDAWAPSSMLRFEPDLPTPEIYVHISSRQANEAPLPPAGHKDPRLNRVVSGYEEAALFADANDADGEPIKDPPEWSRSAKRTNRDQCSAFLWACEEAGLDLLELDSEQIGHDFWLTRNGHGAGFWDRGLGPVGDQISAIAKRFGECSLDISGFTRSLPARIDGDHLAWALPPSGMRSPLEPILPWITRESIAEHRAYAVWLAFHHAALDRGATSDPNHPPPDPELSTERTLAGDGNQNLLLDWIETERPDLGRMTFAQAWAAQAAWHREFAKEANFRSSVSSGVPLVVYPDGARIVRLVTQKQLLDEGGSLGHCVGTNHWKYVRDGTEVILSYRDPLGVPQVTVAITPTDPRFDTDATVSEFKGPGNEAVEDAQGAARMLQFLIDQHLDVGKDEVISHLPFHVPRRLALPDPLYAALDRFLHEGALPTLPEPSVLRREIRRISGSVPSSPETLLLGWVKAAQRSRTALGAYVQARTTWLAFREWLRGGDTEDQASLLAFLRDHGIEAGAILGRDRHRALDPAAPPTVNPAVVNGFLFNEATSYLSQAWGQLREEALALEKLCIATQTLRYVPLDGSSRIASREDGTPYQFFGAILSMRQDNPNFFLDPHFLVIQDVRSMHAPEPIPGRTDFWVPPLAIQVLERPDLAPRAPAGTRGVAEDDLTFGGRRYEEGSLLDALFPLFAPASLVETEFRQWLTARATRQTEASDWDTRIVLGEPPPPTGPVYPFTGDALVGSVSQFLQQAQASGIPLGPDERRTQRRLEGR